MDILAGIVTFNPNLELLQKNLASVLSQVDYLLIVDNHSDNYEEINNLRSDKVYVIDNESNRGIACALNQEFRFAKEKGFKWVLTLDQDTIIPDNMLSEYKKYCDYEAVGMLTCRIQDRNLELNNIQYVNEYDYISDCITSGSLLQVDVWEIVNGFCEDMFIDSVDHDMCFNLLEHGYKILRVNNVALSHAVGESIYVISFGKRYQLYNETPLRNYYQFRNCIYLLKRHKKIVLKAYKYGWLGFALSRINRAYLISR